MPPEFEPRRHLENTFNRRNLDARSPPAPRDAFARAGSRPAHRQRQRQRNLCKPSATRKPAGLTRPISEPRGDDRGLESVRHQEDLLETIVVFRRSSTLDRRLGEGLGLHSGRTLVLDDLVFSVMDQIL